MVARVIRLAPRLASIFITLWRPRWPLPSASHFGIPHWTPSLPPFGLPVGLSLRPTPLVSPFALLFGLRLWPPLCPPLWPPPLPSYLALINKIKYSIYF